MDIIHDQCQKMTVHKNLLYVAWLGSTFILPVKKSNVLLKQLKKEQVQKSFI